MVIKALDPDWIRIRIRIRIRIGLQPQPLDPDPENEYGSETLVKITISISLFRNVLTTYEYEIIVDYTPSISHMLLITGTDKKQSKVILTTNQVKIH